MNSKIAVILKSGTLVLFCGLIGCSGLSSATDQPLQNGYSIVVYYDNSPLLEQKTARSELQYQGQTGEKRVVWPFIEDVVINDDTAVFLGMLHGEAGFNGKHLFAYQPSGSLVDITSQILGIVANDKGADFLKASPTAGVSTLKKEGKLVKIGITSTDWSMEIKLNWNQISDIMRKVKEKGIVRKDRVWGTSYIEKESKPDEQNK